MLVGTEDGAVLIVEGGELVKVISNIHPKTAGISSIVLFDRVSGLALEHGGEHGYGSGSGFLLELTLGARPSFDNTP